MSEINDLVEVGDRVCASIDRLINEEKKFYEQLGYYLKLYRIDLEKSTKNISTIRDKFGDYNV